MVEWSPSSLAFRINGEADRPQLHLQNGMMSIPAMRRSGEAEDVAGLDRREHALEGNGRYVMAFIHDDLAVSFYDVINETLMNQALDHGHVEAPVWLALTTADLADLPLSKAEKHGELRHPLIEKRTAMDEHKRAPRSSCRQIGPKHCLPDAGWRDEHTDVVSEKRSCRLLLERCELTIEVCMEGLAFVALVFDNEVHAMFQK